ncbi:DEAD/DEAH box helicase [Tamaricihabitans halophyticus]|uniref:DEAD/DEAH box helicase n=1 Tax=Tamaricihabitans halophyticus TaxID=1262583 RepID=UPI001FB3BBD4|nr:DEAD/DEAH box helicase [Tamaricihabitans halophyticus]
MPEKLLDALSAQGMEKAFPIQAATLPDALAGRDVLGRARTGSGKTLAFGLALLTKLQGGKSASRKPRSLVLVPTRELALQVNDALIPLAKAMGLWCGVSVGGMAFVRQEQALRKGIDVLIATPGRLADHMRQGTCDLSDVQVTAIDEADQLADMGFLPQICEILDQTPADGQRLLFSATLDGEVDTLVRGYLTDPVTHAAQASAESSGLMDHHLLVVAARDKTNVVTEVAAREGRTILFVRTKTYVDTLTENLRNSGVAAGALHGGKTQGARNRVLSEFRSGTTPVLVATDVAARGIHVPDVSLVVHVDPPADAKDYLHRAGRTARAGASGTVVTMVTHEQRRTVRRLTERAGVRPKSTNVSPGAEELAQITGAQTPSGVPVPEPKQKERGGGRGPARNRRPGNRSQFTGNRAERRAREHRNGEHRNGGSGAPRRSGRRFHG